MALEAARKEVARAAQINHGCLLEGTPTAVHVAYGMRRPSREPALRAIRAACDQVESLASMRWGENGGVEFVVVLVPFGESAESSVLAEHVPTGTALVTESTLRATLQQLPANWETTELPDPSEEKRQILIGPNVRTAPELAAFRFRGLGRSRLGVELFRVDRPERNDHLATQELYSSPQLKRLGDYQLTALLGRGATAEVWRAHTESGEVVAIKRLRDSATASEQHRRRFEREAAVLSRLDHPNICRVRGLHTTADDRYIAMDYVEGASLAEVLVAISCAGSSMEARLDLGLDLAELVHHVERSRPAPSPHPDEPPTTARSIHAPGPGTLPVAQGLAVMRKIALAVQHAHHHGVLHRDLKPANILIRADGEPIVTDFGLAKLTSPYDTSISIADQILGTLEYMAPEQARSSREVDARADVYALGAILYELLTGRRAFIGSGHLLHDAERLQTHQPIPPRELNVQLDSNLELIVLKALRQRPAERYGSVAEFLADLERFARGEAIHAQPASLRARAAAVASAFRRRFS